MHLIHSCHYILGLLIGNLHWVVSSTKRIVARSLVRGQVYQQLSRFSVMIHQALPHIHHVAKVPYRSRCLLFAMFLYSFQKIWQIVSVLRNPALLVSLFESLFGNLSTMGTNETNLFERTHSTLYE